MINLNFNFNNPLNTENNIINEESFDQSNDEELLDFSFLSRISLIILIEKKKKRT